VSPDQPQQCALAKEARKSSRGLAEIRLTLRLVSDTAAPRRAEPRYLGCYTPKASAVHPIVSASGRRRFIFTLTDWELYDNQRI